MLMDTAREFGFKFYLCCVGLQDDCSAILFAVQHIDWID